MARFINYVLLISLVQGQSLTDVRSLYNNLFSNYTKEVLPMSDHSKPLEIEIVLYLVSLNYFKEVDETLSLISCFHMTWLDSSLTWDPSTYGNLEETIFDPKDMWKPSMFLVNRVDAMKPIGHDVDFPVYVNYTGGVNYLPGGLLEAKCPTNIAKFPFDTQECTLEIMTWGVNTTYIKLVSLFPQASLEWYTTNSDWILEEYTTTVVNKTGYHLLYLKLQIKRKPVYFGIIIILPTLLFAVLNPFVFMLPVEAGERVSFAMTILLSYAIFLTLVTASIPASSNPMCVLLVIMIVIIAISGLITAGAIISVKYYYKEDVSKTLSLLKSIARRKINKQTDVALSIDEDKKVIVTGKHISDALDSLFFYGSYMLLVITTVAFFIYVYV